MLLPIWLVCILLLDEECFILCCLPFCPGSEEIPLVFGGYAFLCQGFLIEFLPHLTQLHLFYVWCFCALTCVGNCLEPILENTV